MGDFKARIKAKLLRRHSGVPSLGSSKHSVGRHRASSSTHTNASTSGYAASLSTGVGDEKASSERGRDREGNSGNSSSSRGSNHSSHDSSPRNGSVVVVVGPSQDRNGDGDGEDRKRSEGRGGQSDQHNQNGQRDERGRSQADTVPPELEEEELEELDHPKKLKQSNLDLVSTRGTDGTDGTDGTRNLHGTLEVEVEVNSLNLTRSYTASTPAATATATATAAAAATTTAPTSPAAPTTSKSGKDLRSGAFSINSTSVPESVPTIPDSNLNPYTNINTNANTNTNTYPISNPNANANANQNTTITSTTNLNPTVAAAAASPLPSIHEHRPAASILQLKPPTVDHHHHHHHHHRDEDDYKPASTGRALSPSSSLSRPAAPPRRQSILPNRQTTLIKALLNTGYASEIGSPEPDQLLPISGNMVTRKVWVKRPLASPTLITINEEDLVDDVRELILRKYANSLGRQFDAPDLTLRICDREQQTTRPLQPDEPMGRTLDAYYPGGQSVDDALLIDIPSRRTPKASPNPRYYGGDDRPHESGTDYFPPYPPASQHPGASSSAVNTTHQLHLPPSLTILGGGQLPPLPSPGGTRRLGTRPKIQRMHTASPVSTITNGHASQSAAPPTEHSNHPPTAPSISTPPVPERTATPPPRVSSPRPVNRPKKTKKAIEHPSLPPGMLNGGVPPINVLIVEDNIINLKLLEAFVKRLKVRWQTAMNGREAVNKWRAGGFHLVLMDIQLPVMSGLEATREIRRIEKVNSIGVFSSSASSPPDEVKAEPAEEDKLVNTEMFKSPVIIVALTASSLQSDRHEALAAGCNDFLTKPVNFVWLERKVMEWGCMQALIDFDGWRKWKDFSQKAEEDDSKKAATTKGTKMPKKNRLSMTAAA
ncbi:response regulator receiver domain-containing protein [Annulohypoxylon stygium]|nr:response regulator receiver domain-containing protein [Annulohypoxylon stygium]